MYPCIDVQNPTVGAQRYGGRTEILFNLETDTFRARCEPQFVAHRYGSNLDDLIRQAYVYIKACSLDPYCLSTIGGHIHIATITPKDGFNWVAGFEPKPERPVAVTHPTLLCQIRRVYCYQTKPFPKMGRMFDN